MILTVRPPPVRRMSGRPVTVYGSTTLVVVRSRARAPREALTSRTPVVAVAGTFTVTEVFAPARVLSTVCTPSTVTGSRRGSAPALVRSAVTVTFRAAPVTDRSGVLSESGESVTVTPATGPSRKTGLPSRPSVMRPAVGTSMLRLPNWSVSVRGLSVRTETVFGEVAHRERVVVPYG